MLAKKMTASIAVLLATAAMSAPAFADRGYHRGHGYGHGQGHRVVVHKPHYVVHRPAVVHHYYRPAPQPVAVVHKSHVNPGALIFGAMLGAVIVHAATSTY